MVLECPALRPYLLGMTDIVQTLLDAALPHVPFDGWSAETFDAAVRDTAIDPVVARGVCPRGAMDLAIAKARQSGVGIVTVRNATHFGAAGCYAQMAADEDMIGLAATGYLFVHGQKKAVVPFGGILPMFSTNPLAMACPHHTPPRKLKIAAA